MISSSEIKLIKSLEMKKYRFEHGLFVVEGEKIVAELLQSGLKIREIFCSGEHSPFSKQPNCRIISEKQLERISFLKTPNKVLAVAEIPETVFSAVNTEAIGQSLILALDSINDPGNLGTILRIANWYGIGAVLCSDGCVDCFSPKVVQSSMGALFRTSVFYGDLVVNLRSLKEAFGFRVYSAELGGISVYESEISPKSILVLGSESHGISPEISLLADLKIEIPSYPPGNTAMESLNVGVAAGILCAEFRRNHT